MKEQLVLTKEPLVIAEEGLKQAEPMRRTTNCGERFLRYAKYVLYIEAIFFLGWSSYILWQAYNQHFDVQVNVQLDSEDSLESITRKAIFLEQDASSNVIFPTHEERITGLYPDITSEKPTFLEQDASSNVIFPTHEERITGLYPEITSEKPTFLEQDASSNVIFPTHEDRITGLYPEITSEKPTFLEPETSTISAFHIPKPDMTTEFYPETNWEKPSSVVMDTSTIGAVHIHEPDMTTEFYPETNWEEYSSVVMDSSTSGAFANHEENVENHRNEGFFENPKSLENYDEFIVSVAPDDKIIADEPTIEWGFPLLWSIHPELSSVAQQQSTQGSLVTTIRSVLKEDLESNDKNKNSEDLSGISGGSFEKVANDESDESNGSYEKNKSMDSELVKFLEYIGEKEYIDYSDPFSKQESYEIPFTSEDVNLFLWGNRSLDYPETSSYLFSFERADSKMDDTLNVDGATSDANFAPLEHRDWQPSWATSKYWGNQDDSDEPRFASMPVYPEDPDTDSALSSTSKIKNEVPDDGTSCSIVLVDNIRVLKCSSALVDTETVTDRSDDDSFESFFRTANSRKDLATAIVNVFSFLTVTNTSESVSTDVLSTSKEMSTSDKFPSNEMKSVDTSTDSNNSELTIFETNPNIAQFLSAVSIILDVVKEQDPKKEMYFE